MQGWPCPSPAAALKKLEPILCWGSTVELALVAGGEGVAGELALTLADLVVAWGHGRDTSPPHYSLTACGRLESWFHPSAAAALGRAHSTPDLGSPAELALEAWA